MPARTSPRGITTAAEHAQGRSRALLVHTLSTIAALLATAYAVLL